jgi:hypothetical protein
MPPIRSPRERRARCGDEKPLARGYRALPTTHALHGDMPVADVGSMAATRKLRLAPDVSPDLLT